MTTTATTEILEARYRATEALYGPLVCISCDAEGTAFDAESLDSDWQFDIDGATCPSCLGSEA